MNSFNISKLFILHSKHVFLLLCFVCISVSWGSTCKLQKLEIVSISIWSFIFIFQCRWLTCKEKAPLLSYKSPAPVYEDKVFLYTLIVSSLQPKILFPPPPKCWDLKYVLLEVWVGRQRERKWKRGERDKDREKER